MTLHSEIEEGPAVVERLLERATDPIGALASAVRERAPRHVVIAARGTSDHAAIYAQYVLGLRNRLSVGLAAPSLVSIYDRAPRLEDALVIGISQSGRSPDVVSVLADARRQGALTAALTNDPASELGRAAEHLIRLEAGEERATAATKTYLAEIAVLAMLSAAIDDGDDAWGELRAIPDAQRVALSTEPTVERLATGWAAADRCAVLARGLQYATARECALKIKELAYVLADPYSAADFEHGPLALIEPGYPVLAIATRGPALPGIADLIRRLADAGARLLVVSDDPATATHGEAVQLAPGTPEWLAPLVAIVPCQLLAFHLARARGVDPDAPRTIQKVTLTT